MAFAELIYEYLLGGIESARGTKLDPPTHFLNLYGTITPRQTRYKPVEKRGVLAEFYRTKTVRQWSEWDGKGGADVYTLPLFLECITKGGVTPTQANSATVPAWEATHAYALNALVRKATDNGHYYKVTAPPAGGTSGAAPGPDFPTTSGGTVADNDITWTEQGLNPYLWTYTPTMNADDLKTLTLYWGDPNIQAFQCDYGLVENLKLIGDASGTEGVQMEINGLAHFPAKDAPNSVPTMLNAPLLSPADMDLYIDTTSAIGSTAVTGRVVSAEFNVPSGTVQKYLAVGAGGGMEFSALGRKPRHVELKLVMEIPDMTQYDLWAAGTSLKVRVRWSGPVIYTTFRYYIECDIYGAFDSMDWGELEGTNRTIAMTIMSEYNVTAATDFAIKVQNDRITM